MDKQQKWMDFQYRDNNGVNYAFVLFCFVFFLQTVVVRLLEMLKDKVHQVT